MSDQITSSFTVGSTTGNSLIGYSNGETYTSSSSQDGNVWGSGASPSSSTSFTTSQSLTVIETTEGTNYTGTFGSSSTSAMTGSSTNSTNRQQSYSDSGTMSSTGASQTVTDSPVYGATVSRCGSATSSSTMSSTYSGETNTSVTTGSSTNTADATASQTEVSVL